MMSLSIPGCQGGHGGSKRRDLFKFVESASGLSSLLVLTPFLPTFLRCLGKVRLLPALHWGHGPGKGIFHKMPVPQHEDRTPWWGWLSL